MIQYLPTVKFKFIDTKNFDISKVKDDDKYGYIRRRLRISSLIT